MKKIMSFTLAATFAVLCFAGCSSLPDPSTYLSDLPEMEEYDLETYLDYYWGNSEKTMYHESFLPLSSVEGEKELEVKLMFTPEKIIAVQNFNATVTYEAGKDYYLKEGKLFITENSSITRTPNDYYFIRSETNPDVNAFYQLADKSGFTPLCVNGDIESRMILVSYTYSDNWEGPIPAKKGSLIPKTLSKLENGEDVTIVLYGDSIAYGADSSCFKPIFGDHQVPKYFDLATAALREKYSSKITAVDTAVGGWNITDGLKNYENCVLKYNPDLTIIAFGMNDYATVGRTYVKKIKQLIDTLRGIQPDMEIIVVSSMLPNELILKTNRIRSQAEAFAELENEYTGLAFMNMTEIHEYILSKKAFRDMTGNNINHPNDFLARAYAQLLLNTMEK